MAKKRRTGERKPRTPVFARQGKFTSAQRLRSYNNIVTDRVNYLKYVMAPSVTFKNARDAQREAKKIEKETGAVYDVKGKQLKLRGINRAKVKESTTMKGILQDLKSKGDGANGRKSKALQELGRRETWYGFAVGDTNHD